MRKFFSKLFIFILILFAFICKDEKVAKANEFKSFVYTEKTFSVEYVVNDKWDELYYDLTFEIENTSDDTIENWFLGMALDGNIEQIWNAEVYIQEENHYIIKNASYNSNIAPGAKVSFGCILVLDKEDVFPNEFYMPVKTEKVDAGRFNIYTERIESWEGGSNYKITIKNTSKCTIEDWSIEFDLDGDIDSIWDARIITKEGGRYRLSNSGYNRTIKSEESVSFNLIINGEEQKEFENVMLYEVTSDGIRIAEKLINATYFDGLIGVTDNYEVIPLYTIDGRISAYLVQYYSNQFEPAGYVVVSNEVDCLNYYIEFGTGKSNIIKMMDSFTYECSEERRMIYVGGYTYYFAVADDIYVVNGEEPRKLTVEEEGKLSAVGNSTEYYQKGACLNIAALFEKEVDFEGQEKKYTPNCPYITEFITMNEAKEAYWNANTVKITNHCGPTAATNILICLDKIGYKSLAVDNKGWGDTFCLLYDRLMERWYSKDEGCYIQTTLTGNFVEVLNSILYGVEAYCISDISWNTVKALLEKEAIVLNLQGSEIYGNHYVIGTGYHVFKYGNGWNSRYIRIMDGWGKEHRYVNYSLGIDSINAIVFDFGK